ncbi:MAG TPA: helicase-exonuclease AddAB subunit AddA [Verrucomicrobiae bacterium]|nr:helicase-exonuclease AddAB subunit AddA [Verrucomicrobiae bacterium]
MESAGKKNSLTDAQQHAVAARGNVLVMAGAGTGKTHTLVARCLNLICDEKVSLDEILIVTFTEAAATEMKQRLRAALEKESRENSDSFLSEQLALFDIAHIGTLHSFCFKLVREHFHELGLDPQISILDEGQTRLLADETLEEIFNSHYENADEFSLAVQELIKIYGNGLDEKIRALILRLHHYIQTRADSEKWLAQQIENFSSAEPIQWREWFAEAVSNWRAEWLPVLENLKAENSKAAECLEILKSNSADFFQKILATDENYPARKKTALRKPLEDFFDDAKFLNSLVATKENDPLAEDWNWIRGYIKTLLQLARKFSEAFSTRKRADGVLDFHDLEQFALKLLWNFESETPTEIANHWREKLKFVFVDEYQDINAAQDKIISALSRDGKNANRFLVGDVKQSIYRFRLANPKIFRDYAQNWRGENEQTIPLTENFRSRESLLNFVNSVFTALMREEIGGVNYDEDTKLKFGSPEARAEFSIAKDSSPRADLLLRFKKNRNDDSETDNDLADLEESEKEARMLALRLRELKNSGHEVWDDEQRIFRAADWRDMAILLRAPSGKSEIFAKQFEQIGVPLHVERGGFYDSSEISDLLSVLELLDNPLQDVPLIAVLRSPLVGCALDELAEIRLLQKDGKFWFALNLIQNSKFKIQNELRAKIDKFLERFSRWRKMAKQISLSQYLEGILDETHYADWLKAQARGAQKFANVQRFLHLAEKFDQFQRQGLFRFLNFVKAQREIEAEPEVALVAEENAVRLMSIHQSKGLEFPIVALADLGKNFNEQDLRGEIILDEQFGLCPRVKPPNAGGRYPSLSYWLAQKNQRRELCGEELRLFYVALTRARDNLILTASISEKKWETFFENAGAISSREILSARNFLDWLGIWFRVQSPKVFADGHHVQNETHGELENLRWRIVDDEELTVEKAESGKRKAEMDLPSLNEITASKLQKIFDWEYAFAAATKRAAKTSVTALRQQADELDDEAERKFQVSSFKFSAGRARTQNPQSAIRNRQLSAADAGTAAHQFLQHFDFESATDLQSLEVEARRLEKENYLAADERAVLELKNIAAFWSSEIGEKILSQKDFIRRELPFTAKFSTRELDEILETQSSADLGNEFVVVQGVADLVVLLPEEIWVVDFKTDGIDTNELAERIKMYSPQLKLYARALGKIYSKPMTNRWLHFLSARRTETI